MQPEPLPASHHNDQPVWNHLEQLHGGGDNQTMAIGTCAGRGPPIQTGWPQLEEGAGEGRGQDS